MKIIFVAHLIWYLLSDRHYAMQTLYPLPCIIFTFTVGDIEFWKE